MGGGPTSPGSRARCFSLCKSITATKNKMSTNEDVNCTGLFDDVLNCASARYQFGYYYMYGEVDSCREIYKDFGICLKAKTKPRKEAHKMLRGTRFDKRKPSPTAEIWEFKTTPNWD